MITGPLFKWFGSKWLAGPHLPVPRFDDIVSLFAGGAGYELRHWQRRVVLHEANPLLVRLWSWLIHEATEAVIREIPVGLPVGADIRAVGLSDGQALLLKHWQRTNNVGDCWTVSPWGDKPGQWTTNTRARVASEFHHVRHWQIRGDVASLQVDGPATWFVDPMYEFNYQYRMPRLDYAALGALCRRLPGQVIVCEARCPKTGDAPTWLPFADFRSSVTSRRKASEHHHSRELLWVSG